MKKIFIILVIVTIIVSAGALFVRGQELPVFLNEGFSEGNYGSCHSRTFNPSFEWIYAHLSEENQQLVDQKYLELLAEQDLSLLTPIEQQMRIDDIKVLLITYIYESNFYIYRRY